jgi:hypothetical protein
MPEEILPHFDLGGAVTGLRPAAEGHINRSWIVSVSPSAEYLLQRLNERVFPSPELVMVNVDRVTCHLADALAHEGTAGSERRTLRLVRTREGRAFHCDRATGVWRVYPFISGASVREHVTTRSQARETGRAFGTFQRLLASYAGPPLHETIQCFHDTARRVQSLERAVSDDWARRVAGARAEIDAALARRALADVLPPLLASGEVPGRITHNDAKSSNVLLDDRTGEALCVVDLDTVMPGTALYDFGDLVRSATSPTAEDESDTSRIGARSDLFEGLAEGFLEETRGVLTRSERELLVQAGRIITFEQAVRFLTDYLDGDRYYRTAYPGHNLVRCRAQLALLESLERHDAEFGEVVRTLGDE